MLSGCHVTRQCCSIAPKQKLSQREIWAGWTKSYRSICYRSNNISDYKWAHSVLKSSIINTATNPMLCLVVLTFKTQQTSSTQYLNQHISLRTSARNTRSSSVPLLCVSFRRTSFARRSFSTAAPLTWNSLPPAVLNCDSLSLLSNPELKLICFLPAFC